MKYLALSSVVFVVTLLIAYFLVIEAQPPVVDLHSADKTPESGPRFVRASDDARNSRSAKCAFCAA
jgi:hypothetical protein